MYIDITGAAKNVPDLNALLKQELATKKYEILYHFMPPPLGGGIKQLCCLTSVCREHRA